MALLYLNYVELPTHTTKAGKPQPQREGHAIAAPSRREHSRRKKVGVCFANSSQSFVTWVFTPQVRIPNEVNTDSCTY